MAVNPLLSAINMSDSFATDVKAYYAAKEPYESLLRDSEIQSATTGKDEEMKQKKTEEELHPLLIPSFGEMAFSKAAQQGGKSAAKKSS